MKTPRTKQSKQVAEHQPQEDFRVTNHGSIVMLYPISDEAKDWVVRHLPEDTLTLGPGYAIEPRYAGPIVEGIQEEGLTIR